LSVKVLQANDGIVLLREIPRDIYQIPGDSPFRGKFGLSSIIIIGIEVKPILNYQLYYPVGRMEGEDNDNYQ